MGIRCFAFRLFLLSLSLSFSGFGRTVSSLDTDLGTARVVFQVDKGFVAQVADVVGGRTVPMNEEQSLEAEKTVVGEFIFLSSRYSDPDSASSSFSVLLGDAPHLDGQYAIFGRVTKGDDTLRKLEELPTRREGIFVMPTERITIFSTYYYDTTAEKCEWEKEILKRRLSESFIEVERQVENEMPPVNGPEVCVDD
ncbi:hypothetical protein BHE74_00058825 [Ensete ventricosum]|nr:hypothetical protein BHE74_00058825 [Ensete ventricosum]